MKSKLSEDLWTHFPWTRPDPEDQMSPWTLFGFECGDGWHQLLSDMFFEIEEQYLSEGREVDLKIGQIKEKFGTLRAYIHGGKLKVQDIIDKYEGLSAEVCEDCGASGNLHDLNGWILTLCNACYEETTQEEFHYYDENGNQHFVSNRPDKFRVLLSMSLYRGREHNNALLYIGGSS